MRGFMFASPDPFHDFPVPFGPDTEWVDMRCKYGNHRPFLAEDAVMLEDGEMFKVEYPDPPKPLEFSKVLEEEADGSLVEVEYPDQPTAQTWTCGICGKEAKSNAGLSAHMKVHQ
jgi:hypothetical protein